MPSKILRYTCVLAFILACQINYAQNTIIGKWMLIEDADTSYMIFDNEGYFSILLKSGEGGEKEVQTIGGKGFEVDGGIFADFKYTLDTTKLPHQVEAALYLANTDILVGLIPGIFKFEKKALLINLYDDRFNAPDGRPFTPQKINAIRAMRPKNFDNDIQVLTRVK